MNKRQFLVRTGVVGSGLVALAVLVGTLVSTAAADGEGFLRLRSVSGPLANVTVTFGEWKTDPPLDRFPNVSPIAANQHNLLPQQSRIQKGGSVNFIISGLHQLAIYGPGTPPGAINVNSTTPTTGTPQGVPLINDPTNRVFRGVDPSLFPLDRVEAVHFSKPGTYLVICAVRPHFVNDGMFGFVKVLGEDSED